MSENCVPGCKNLFINTSGCVDPSSFNHCIKYISYLSLARFSCRRVALGATETSVSTGDVTAECVENVAMLSSG